MEKITTYIISDNLKVSESLVPDRVEIHGTGGSVISLSKDEWKELCGLTYYVNFKSPPAPVDNVDELFKEEVEEGEDL